MRLSHLGLMTAAVLLTACNKEVTDVPPPGGPEDFLRAADVLVAAQCELDRAAARDPAKVRFRKAEVTLTLTVQRTESTGGGVTLTIPIAATNIALRRDRTPSGSALRKMDFRSTYELGSQRSCPSKDVPTTPEGVRHIEGGLGLEEWIAEIDTLAEKSGGPPSEANYQITFEIAVNNSLAPEFSRPLSDVDGALTTRDLTSREVRHRIAITILPDTSRSRAAGDRALTEAADHFLERIDE